MVSDGRRKGEWTTIPVPSNWELHGFGTYTYGQEKNKAVEEGRYRHRFDVPAAWKDRRVFLIFEGSMTDTEIAVNGRAAGRPRHARPGASAGLARRRRALAHGNGSHGPARQHLALDAAWTGRHRQTQR